jgi:cell division initiation protein
MLMPVEIREKEFVRVMRGFDPKEVRDTLNTIADDFAHLLDENRELLEKLAAYEKLESNLRNTLILAQKTADDTKKNADKQREGIIKDAKEEAKKIKAEAEKILLKAKNEKERTEEEIKEREKKIIAEMQERKMEVERELGRLEAKRDSFKANFRGLLSSYLEELTPEDVNTGEKK